MCVPCLPKLWLRERDKGPSSVPGMSGLTLVKLNFFISQNSIPHWDCHSYAQLANQANELMVQTGISILNSTTVY